MRPYLRFTPLAIFMVITFSLASGLLMPSKQELMKPPIIGTYLPDFALPRVDDPAALLIARNWRGQVSVLNFFASWCEPCKVEHPVLMTLAQRPDIRMYGVAWKDDAAKAAEYLRKHGNPYTATASDANGSLTVSLGLGGVPETLVIDKQGVVRWKHSGPLTEDIVRNELIPLISQYAAQP